MALTLVSPYLPMEAQLVTKLPSGEHWLYEPKWDGFRCLAFRDGGAVELQSKAGQTLTRYFPELVSELLQLKAATFVLDGEIVIPAGDQFSFEELLMRIHPAESRVRKLAVEHPALLIVFDILEDETDRPLVDLPLSERRPVLEEFVARCVSPERRLRLSASTRSFEEAARWLREAGGSVDGVIAKRLDMRYQAGERTGMQKVKLIRTADCVIGGFRYGSGSKLVGSLLLGLYDDKGLLNHVGFTSGLKEAEKPQLTSRLEALVKPPGFTGRAPGGKSRWATERSMEWQPVDPRLVIEVSYDHFTGGRFRHGTRLLRWRPDKAPTQCTMDQVERLDKNPAELLKL